MSRALELWVLRQNIRDFREYCKDLPPQERDRLKAARRAEQGRKAARVQRHKRKRESMKRAATKARLQKENAKFVSEASDLRARCRRCWIAAAIAASTPEMVVAKFLQGDYLSLVRPIDS